MLFGPCVLREIAHFPGVLAVYQSVVVDFHDRNGVIYEGPSRGAKIVLKKNGDHYDIVTNVNIFITTISIFLGMIHVIFVT